MSDDQATLTVWRLFFEFNTRWRCQHGHEYRGEAISITGGTRDKQMMSFRYCLLCVWAKLADDGARYYVTGAEDKG